ncbi:transmembrane protein 45B [Rhipicephalus microplus]|uniref:transmembrane protein 45B n=1 Tax=Rhipicephalus microplus TaxID=6941 RepID=UPI003F6AD2AB
MGTFIGHALTGSFLFFFGTWWTFAAWRNYVRSRETKRRYQCRCSYAVPGLPPKFSTEGIVKITSCCICIAMESSVTSRRNSLAYTESVLQQTMYAFFLLNGVVDVLYNAGLPLPPNTDYVVLLIATASEGLLFHFYLQGKPLLDVMIHTLLVYTIAALVACLIAEMCRPRSILASLGRAYFCLLQATWLWQIAFILYNPLPGYKPWDVQSHIDSMMATSVFAWHMIAVLVYVGTLGAVAWAVNEMCGSFCEDLAIADAERVGNFCEAFITRDM